MHPAVEWSDVSFATILMLMYLWSRQTRVTEAAAEVKISNRVAIDWFNFFRDVCAEYFLAHPITIGGPGKVVEIDESKFGKRKYNRGRSVDGHWVFGGIERGTPNAFQQYIRPGTTVISDEWRAYLDIPTLGYTHQTVNHSENFVDPSTGAHTQSVEGHWSCTKRMMRKQGVMNTTSDLFPSYLLEFLWRRRFGESDLFEKLLEHIAEQNPL